MDFSDDTSMAGAVRTLYTFIATCAAAKSKELRQHLLKQELQRVKSVDRISTAPETRKLSL